MPVDSVGIKAHILTLSEGDVLFRKPRKFELSSSNTFEFSKKYDRGVKFNPPPLPGQIGLNVCWEKEKHDLVSRSAHKFPTLIQY